MNRQGYQKTIYNSELPTSATTLLAFMATYCDDDLTVKRGDMTAERIAKRLKWGQERVRSTVDMLKKAKLLTVVKRPPSRLRFYQLPTEDDLAAYQAP